MDLTPTEAERALRDECRAWLREQPAVGVRQGPAAALRRPRRRGRVRPRVAGEARGRPVGRRRVARGVRRARRGTGRALHRHRGAGPGARAGARRPHRRQPRRPDAARARHRRAEGALAPADPRRAGDLVPAVQRARRGQRPRVAHDARRRASTAAGCSTARRCGRATRSSPTGACASPAPIPTRRSSKGISSLVVDMRAPGVEVRPLRQITDESEFNEVFFTDVFVPDDRLVGPEHEGWRIANSTLTHERGVNPRQLVDPHPARRRAAAARGRATARSTTPGSRHGSREAFVEVRCSSCTTGARSRAPRRARRPGPVGSINKLWWSEMSKRLHDTAMAVLGPAAPLWRGADDNPGDGAWQRSWLYYQASLDLGRHERDPAQRRRRARARPPPRAATDRLGRREIDRRRAAGGHHDHRSAGDRRRVSRPIVGSAISRRRDAARRSSTCPARSARSKTASMAGDDARRSRPRRPFRNITVALDANGATPADVAKITFDVVDWDTEKLGGADRGRDRGVSATTSRSPRRRSSACTALFEPGWLIEIDVTAVID